MNLRLDHDNVAAESSCDLAGLRQEGDLAARHGTPYFARIALPDIVDFLLDVDLLAES